MLNGRCSLLGDKSISHRLLMVGSLINDSSTIVNLSKAKDVYTTIDCLRKCNIMISKSQQDNHIKISGGTLSPPQSSLNCGNSGSTLRMLVGLLSGQRINAEFVGDKSLSKRPMKRIIDPLESMGVEIQSHNNCLPLKIGSNVLNPIDYKIKTDSAQVKTSLILASLGCENYSKISYNYKTRDHTEKILKYLNFDISINQRIHIRKMPVNKGFNITVPGDISNASFLIAAAILIPHSIVEINNILYNKTRMGFIDTLIRMGAKIKISNIKKSTCEYTCTIKVKYSPVLRIKSIDYNNIIEMIDEMPIFCIIATQINGITTINNAGELRNKESDRIKSIVVNLKEMGADITENNDGLLINGGKKLYNTRINHFNDHRIAMSFEILSLLMNNSVSGKYKDIIDISFPEFYPIIKQLIK